MRPDEEFLTAEEDRVDWHVEPADAGERIDKYITESLEDDISRSQIQQWIKDGHVTVNGRVVKANYRLSEEDRVELRIPQPGEAEIQPEAIPLDVAYEDRDVIVVNKPRGMVVHPAPGHYSGTLVNALMHHCKDLSGINGQLRPGIVHRIDKDTSGLIMAAKNDLAHISLARQLKEHSVTRKYLAIVHGSMSHDNGTVDAPIGRDPRNRKLFTVTAKNGKRSVTHFAVIGRYADYSYLELKLETGRTHQIRVHMQFIGHPLVGDPQYGRSRGLSKVPEMTGQALHASILGFEHPRTGEFLQFEAPLPEDMRHLLDMLRSL
ncbi:RluA family pseudouridine synthase [Ferviditalea candida]|uniref:Pseudouridine synthase n=1 Tax=Ferviditalea candida TaxID=3108399 RepID=A0ABU5ZDM4_9BACL|nr:RluA family pseudouridine synthase [Paenibacillaceae bacterium T2]